MEITTLTTHLFRQTKPTEYFLHVITTVNKTSYEAAGNTPIPSVLGEDGQLNIELYIQENPDLPDFGIATPIVHTLKLGNQPYWEQFPEIQISIVKNDHSPNSIGGTTVKTADADEIVRPVFDL